MSKRTNQGDSGSAKKKAAPKKKQPPKEKPVIEEKTDVAPQPETTEAGISHLKPEQLLNARRMLIKSELDKRAEQFQQLLPKHIPVVKFINVVLNACLSNTILLQCTPTSVITCAIRAAQLGLMPEPISGEAHLIPFNNPKKKNLLEAQFLPGYKGLIQLAMRSGTVKKFQARAVYQTDDFDYEFGTEEYIKHKPKNESSDITFVYAIIEYVNGGKVFDVMSRQEIEAVRNEAPEWKSTPERNRNKTFWGARFPDMAKKTVIRRLAKYAPVSPQFQFAVGLDEKVEVIGESQIDIDDINWDELTPVEQEKILLDLLQLDKEKKDLLLNSALSDKVRDRQNKPEQLLQETENLILNQ